MVTKVLKVANLPVVIMVIMEMIMVTMVTMVSKPMTAMVSKLWIDKSLLLLLIGPTLPRLSNPWKASSKIYRLRRTLQSPSCGREKHRSHAEV